MRKYTAEFFIKDSGKSPVEDFLNFLDARTQRKFLYIRSLLEEFGIKLAQPFCKYLRDDIFELRFKGKEGAIRVLYFFLNKNRIIFTNGFVKKMQKAPSKEIGLAIERKKVFLFNEEQNK